ncbi:hypothetical protein [Nocardiopsis algeriensis]|uniref:Uncharacterized protein n=1 Tax=Nocardiopsis algeriensis TaxID=1478215 RepID=A0A841ITG4_9ACTN|nr:hypothetical protein [Nocardiopsis algeriensis]MBB6121604.1 hypothetical protein [Nocardiopsis algeriensis]
MSPVQIVRTVAVALIAGGGALGLVPTGSCGAGWWRPPLGGDAVFGWFAYEELPRDGLSWIDSCDTVMAPVGSWALALAVIGAALWAGVRFSVRPRPEGTPEK